MNKFVIILLVRIFLTHVLQIIENNTRVRLKIVGTRVDATEIVSGGVSLGTVLRVKMHAFSSPLGQLKRIILGSSTKFLKDKLAFFTALYHYYHIQLKHSLRQVPLAFYLYVCVLLHSFLYLCLILIIKMSELRLRLPITCAASLKVYHCGRRWGRVGVGSASHGHTQLTA
jgi:hypothetical protein